MRGNLPANELTPKIRSSESSRIAELSKSAKSPRTPVPKWPRQENRLKPAGSTCSPPRRARRDGRSQSGSEANQKEMGPRVASSSMETVKESHCCAEFLRAQGRNSGQPRAPVSNLHRRSGLRDASLPPHRGFLHWVLSNA
jgi:hypothetical protein